MTTAGRGRRPVKGRFRLTSTGSALAHILPSFVIDRRMWSGAEPSFVVQSIRTLDVQDASELRYAAAMTTWVRWTFQPACGAGPSTGGSTGPSAPDQTAAIPLLRQSGQSQSTVARTFGVSRQTIWRAERTE